MDWRLVIGLVFTAISMNKPQHATITLERFYVARAERVFSEFADPAARPRWSPPTNDVLIYDQCDFREGGRDTFRCGPKNDPKFHGRTSYLLIVPNRLVVSSETIETDGQNLAVSLNTLEIEPDGDRSVLKLTVQIASFVGPSIIAGYEAGNQSALENLSRHLKGNF
jgi:uncharacterized protein YndB with AHSA1/START domain